MKKNYFRSAVAAVLVLLFAAASPVSGGVLEPDCERSQHATAGEIVGDLLIIRPITLAITFVGTGFWIASAPFTLIGGNFRRAGEVMFIEPAMYTFGYPLGSY
jgi:hypothetical protein